MVQGGCQGLTGADRTEAAGGQTNGDDGVVSAIADGQSLPEAVAARRNARFLKAPEVADLLGELRHHRDVDDPQELRGALRMIVDHITVAGESVEVHNRPEAEPWFR